MPFEGSRTMPYTMQGIHYIMPKTFYAYLTFMVSLIGTLLSLVLNMDASTSHVMLCLHC